MSVYRTISPLVSYSLSPCFTVTSLSTICDELARVITRHISPQMSTSVTYVWRIEVATNVRRFFVKTGYKKCRNLENETIVQRRSATLTAFDAVALQWLSLRFQIVTPYVRKPIRNCGWAV